MEFHVDFCYSCWLRCEIGQLTFLLSSNYKNKKHVCFPLLYFSFNSLNWELGSVCLFLCLLSLSVVYFFACEQFHCLFFCLTLWDSRSSSSVRGSLEECLIWKSLKMSVNTRQDENCTFWWKSGCGKNDRIRHGQWGKVMGVGEMEGMLDLKVSPAGLV